MIELLPPGFIYSLFKDGINAVLRQRRKLTPSEVISLRQKWKTQFDEHIWKNYKEKLREDAIIRDMKRMDNYPDLKQSKGISSWFRVSLIGTYHRGIFVRLRFGTLTQCKDVGWRFTDRIAGEQGDIKVMKLGSIPYENIEAVDWDGDGHYQFPHIYCFFAHNKEPYEHVGFYTKTVLPNDLPFYTEIAPYDQVRRRSRRIGTKYFS